MSSISPALRATISSVSNPYLKWFSIVTWLGVPLNLYFAFPALFVPNYLIDTLDLAPGFETVWLRNAGLLIFIVTSYHILAAVAPARYPAVGWLVIGGRLAAAVYWLVVAMNWWETSGNPGAFVPFLVGDLAFGGVTAVLLYKGLQRRRVAVGVG